MAPTPKPPALVKPRKKKDAASYASIGRRPSGKGPDDVLAEGYERDTPAKNLSAEDKKKEADAAHAATLREFLDLAMKRFDMVVTAESDLRKNMLEDRRFEQADHWDPISRANRAADGRPCLTINRLPQFIKLVANQMRANRPKITVTPENGPASVATAQVLSDVIRSIERNSSSDIAYATACDCQLTMGRGYFRVLTEYAEDDGFEQNIIIRRILNPFTVYMDRRNMPDGSDAEFGFIVEDMLEEDFIEAYGKEALEHDRRFEGHSDRGSNEWYGQGTIRVAEYFYRKRVKEKRAWVEIDSASTGMKERRSMLEKDVPKDAPGFRIIERREVERVKVCWAKITGHSVLEGNEDKTAGRDWPGRYIPIVPVIGEESDIDGKINLRGMVRDSRDSARMNSFWMSALTELIAIAPRAPYIGYAGQFKGHEAKWNQAHLRNFAYLEVAPTTHGGQLAPHPVRQPFAADIGAVTAAFQINESNLKATMGIDDPGLGRQGQAESGRAVLALQQKSDLGNSNYSENLAWAVRHCGRILLDMIPRIYSPQRIMRITGETGKQRRVALHVGGAVPPDERKAMLAAGIEGVYDISVGRYDVSVAAGSDVGSKRQQGAEAMLQLVRMYPPAAPLIMDLIVENLDFPNAPQVAERLRSMVPAEVLNPGDMPPQVAAMLQKLKAAYQQLQQQVENDAVKAASDERIKRAELEVKQRIAVLDNLVKLMVAESKINADRGTQLIQAEIDRAQAFIEALGEPIQEPEVPAVPALPPGPPQPPGPLPIPAPGATPEAAVLPPQQ